MNKSTILKSLNELPPGATNEAEAAWAPAPESSAPPEVSTGQDFREMLDHRYNAPYPYSQWGLNE